MAHKMATKTQQTTHYPPGGFDITATIGHVEFSGVGDMTPVEAALRIIGAHGAEGTYRFPHEDGGEWVIDMVHYR
jgi:hypothetical protein